METKHLRLKVAAILVLSVTLLPALLIVLCVLVSNILFEMGFIVALWLLNLYFMFPRAILPEYFFEHSMFGPGPTFEGAILSIGLYVIIAVVLSIPVTDFIAKEQKQSVQRSRAESLRKLKHIMLIFLTGLIILMMLTLSGVIH